MIQIVFAALVVGASARILHSDYVLYTKVCVDITAQQYDLLTINYISYLHTDTPFVPNDTHVDIKQPIVCNHASTSRFRYLEEFSAHAHMTGPRAIDMTTTDSDKNISCSNMSARVCITKLTAEQSRTCLQGKSDIQFIFENSKHNITSLTCTPIDNTVTVCKTDDFDIQSRSYDTCYNLKSKWFWNVPDVVTFTVYAPHLEM